MLIRSALALMLFTAMAPLRAAAVDLTVWGSTTCQKRFLEPAKEPLHATAGIELTVHGVGSGQGLLALLDGRARVAAISSRLDAAVAAATRLAEDEQRALTVPDNLIFHEIIRDRIVPIVHKDNPVTQLSRAQLKDINTGTVSSWSAVGGPDLAIRVITSHRGSATRAVFQEDVMDGADYAEGVKEVRSTRQEIQAVSRYVGAIGAISTGFVEMRPGNTKTVDTDPIERPLGLVTIGEPDAETQTLIEFLRAQAAREPLP